jgi:8-oxo-dGTP diphosphatase
MSFHVGINNILIKDGKVLLGKRLKKAGYGQWGFPGGHLEEGESFVAAAKRELFEETDLAGEDLAFANIANTPQPDKHYIQINFLVLKWSGVLENREPERCEAWDWFLLSYQYKTVYAHTRL